MKPSSRPQPSVAAIPARFKPWAGLCMGLALLLVPGALAAAGSQDAKSSQTAPQTKAPATKTQGSAKSFSGSPAAKVPAVKRRGARKKSKSSHTRSRAQRAPTPERISEVQAALARSGKYSGEPTGKWDAATVQAMKEYQQANGLPATGKLDARTLQKLGLGSPITGVAAPRSPATVAPTASHSSPAPSATVPPAKTPPASPPRL